MGATDTQTHDLVTVIPERDRVRLRPGATLDERTLTRLEDEAHQLIARGFTWVSVDLRDVETVDWTSPATFAAISRYARERSVRFTVLPGTSAGVRRLVSAGLLRDLVAEPPAARAFFDWSR